MILKAFQPITNHLLSDWLKGGSCVLVPLCFWPLWPLCSLSLGFFHSIFRVQQLEDPFQQVETTIRDNNEIVLNPCRIASCTFKLSVIKLVLIRWVALIWKTAPQFYPTRFVPSLNSLSSYVFRDPWSRLCGPSNLSARALNGHSWR